MNTIQHNRKQYEAVYRMIMEVTPPTAHAGYRAFCSHDRMRPKRINIKRLIYLIMLTVVTIQGTPTIHVLGDSHSTCCFGCGVTSGGTTTHHIVIYDIRTKVPFAVHHLGPRTMHRIGRDGLAALNFQSHGVQEGDAVVLTFGEIDVRCHIGKQRDERQRQLSDILDALVNNYIATIIRNREHYHDVYCMVMGVTPPTDEILNENYPQYGTLSDRVTITKGLNLRLQQACALHDIGFIPIHDLFATPEGILHKSASDGTVHINYKHNRPLRMRAIKLFTLRNTPLNKHQLT